MAEGFQLLPWQVRALQTPLDSDLFLGGGRGGGKSYALAALLLQFVALVPGAPLLVVRRTFPGLQDFIGLTMSLFPLADRGARYSSQTHTWRFSNGSTCELGVLDCEADFVRYQGRSFSLIAADEAGQYETPRWLNLLRSCLRAPRGQPVRMILAANPGGPGHHHLFRRYILRRTPWVPFVDETGRTCITIPSTLRDNDTLDEAAYTQQLRGAVSGDTELLKAWLSGDWHVVAGGAYFGDAFDEARNVVPAWDALPMNRVPREHVPPGELHMYESGRWDHRSWPAWNFYLSHDFGVSAPSVTYLCAESPGTVGPDGAFYPRGSIVLVDEYSTHARDDALNEGLGLLVPELAQKLKAMCSYWGVSPQGVADDAVFSRTGTSSVSVAEEFRKCGVDFSPARKGDRVAGWNRMRTMLLQAGMPDKPGLYVSRRCPYWLATVPFLVRDSRRREDLDSRGPDHAADATRYGLLREHQTGPGAVWLRYAKS